jgi:hypothetical protein
MRDFDNHFKSIQRKQESFFRFAMAVWVVIACASLGAVIALVYVVAHFLAKVW